MKYWTSQLYGHRVTARSLWPTPPALLNAPHKFWLWRLAYTGLACDELYSRIIEHVSRRILIIPAICLFDKHLSAFMNAKIIMNTLRALNNKIYRENLSPLDLIRIFMTMLVTALFIWQIILIF